MAKSTRAPRVAKAADPYTDSSIVHPILDQGANTWASLSRDIGSYGLRQYGGYVREDYLPELRGREAMTVYREMLDGNSTVGAIINAVTQAMRSVRWHEVAVSDAPDAQEAAGFATSLRHDMSHSWSEFVAESLSMLGYGFAPLELVYKRRNGRQRGLGDQPSSKFKDGKIGFRRLPIRGQETILHWYFDTNGQTTGLQQMPWVGRLIDIPIEKLLLMRPTVHKGNPEGRSIIRNAYRPHFFIKRLEEMESILFERLSGLPVIYAPASLIRANQAGDKDAMAAYAALQKIANNTRINQQMGIVLPSDLYPGVNGPSNQRMYDFQLVTPQGGHVVDPNPLIQRYKLDILKTVLADFIDLGHQARGTQNLAITKIDMFYKGIEGWLHSIADTYNRHGLSRCWVLNGMDEDLMPHTEPDMVSRVDLDQLGGFVYNLANSGIAMTDPELEDYLRTQAGMPIMTDEQKDQRDADDLQEDLDRKYLEAKIVQPGKPTATGKPAGTAGQQVADTVTRVVARTALRNSRAKTPVRSVSTRSRTTRSKSPLPNGHDPSGRGKGPVGQSADMTGTAA